MLRFSAAIVALLLHVTACGHHETQTFVDKPSDNLRGGSKATTPEELVIKSIETENNEDLETLISDGFKINDLMSDGRTPLQYAIFVDRPRAVRSLIAKGSDPRILDKNGRDAFVYASESTNPARMLLLLDPNQMADMQAKLIQAVQRGRYALIEKAFLDGVDPNFHSDSGETPLTLAILGRKKVVLEVFLKFSPKIVDLKFPNRAGLTALQIAEREQWDEGIGLLKLLPVSN